MSDIIKGVKIKELPEKDTMTDTDILVVEDSEATKQISAEAMKTYFTADLADEIQKLKDENTELSDNLYKSVEFYNGDTWLETVVVMRGDDAVYTGDTPVSTDDPDATFLGWNPEPTNVKENIKCYAQFMTVFAIYSADDYSLSFYTDATFPTENNTYSGKTVTNIYMIENRTYDSSTIPWSSVREDIITVNFDKSFANFKTYNLDYWFSYFSNCTSMNGLNYLNTSLSTSMRSMFFDCTSLTILDLSVLDTSLVTNMRQMFSNCKSLTTLILNGFDTSLVKNMAAMFYECSSLMTLDVSKFDTSSATQMQDMFDYCSSLKTLDVSRFNTSLVTNMNSLFANCNNLTTLNLGEFDTSSVTNMNSMFSNDVSLTTLDLSKFDTNSVTNMTWMFLGSNNLTTIYSDDNLFVTSQVTSSQRMFDGCTKLVGGNGTVYNSSTIDVSMAHVDTPDSPGYFTAK